MITPETLYVTGAYLTGLLGLISSVAVYFAAIRRATKISRDEMERHVRTEIGRTGVCRVIESRALFTEIVASVDEKIEALDSFFRNVLIAPRKAKAKAANR